MRKLFLILFIPFILNAQPFPLLFDDDLPTGTNLFTVSYTGSRNNITGCLGFEFSPDEDIIIIKLGRSVSTAITTNHTIKIWRVSDQTLITSGVVNQSSTVDVLGYAIVNITPVTLVASETYRIASDEDSGGDLWKDLTGMTDHSDKVTITGAVYKTTKGAYPTETLAGANNAFVPPTFYIKD